jgi:4-amino-4-deoxy-L-arabinose transferase-like glycosyltransferase
MHTRLLLALGAVLLLLRLPALVQPMGADQGLYAYVGERILAGELPYRDAWDQKPPAIHYIYAAMRAIWPADAVVGLADLLAAAAVGWLLFLLGRATGSTIAGAAGAFLFLLLSNPSFTRLGGVRLRAQCETFIAVAVTGAFLLLARRRAGGDRWSAAGAGVLFGVAFLLKYHAGVYLAAGLAAGWLWGRLPWRDVLYVATGCALPVLVMIGGFGLSGALRELYDATVVYNLQYSGETYTGPAAVLGYLLTFPVERARVDALWTVGGAGSLVLLLTSRGRRERLVGPMWVAAACLSIAVNGGRGLPQYFVQANPALALAAGWGAVHIWELVRARAARAAPAVAALIGLVVSVGVWRVNQFPKLLDQTAFDAAYALGRLDRAEYLARYDDDRKYSALAAEELAALVRTRTQPEERIYLFGFTCAAYVLADRASASRFFWSRPVIVGFRAGTPGYGIDGLLNELRHRQPGVVALQRKDWADDVSDSADFFMNTPALAGWLRANYVRTPGPTAFDLWVPKARGS